MPKIIIFASNRSFGLYSSRKELIESFSRSGWLIIICCNDATSCSEFHDKGYLLFDIPFERGGISFSNDILSISKITWIILRYRPKIIHAFNAKPIIFFGLISKLYKKTSFYATITGLGNAFLSGGFLKKISSLGYKFVFSNPRARIIFQNSDDLSFFVTKLSIPKERTKLVLGSGVDLSLYTYDEKNTTKKNTVLMISRLIKQKGILEFVELAQRLHSAHPNFKFLIVGEEEHDHPDSVSLSSLSTYIQKGIIEYGGYSSDIPALLESAYILVHPSHQEGMPRVVMEASACGVPSIGFNVPGVRECIKPGINGVTVNFGDIDALTKVVGGLLEDPNKRLAMSQSSRILAERHFDRRQVLSEYLKYYREMSEPYKRDLPEL